MTTGRWMAVLPVILGGCTTIPMYGGPERPPNQVALLVMDETRLERVDSLDAESADRYAILPGLRHVRVRNKTPAIIPRGSRFPAESVTLCLDAQAGHTYRIQTTYSGDVWRPAVVDLQSGQVLPANVIDNNHPDCGAGASAISSNPQTPAGALTAGKGRADLYIYRTGTRGASTPDVSVDGRLTFSPSDGTYTIVSLEAGVHKVDVRWSWTDVPPPTIFRLPIEADHPVYVKIGASGHLDGFGRFESESYAEAVPESLAAIELKYCCKYSPPKSK